MRKKCKHGGFYKQQNPWILLNMPIYPYNKYTLMFSVIPYQKSKNVSGCRDIYIILCPKEPLIFFFFINFFKVIRWLSFQKPNTIIDYTNKPKIETIYRGIPLQPKSQNLPSFQIGKDISILLKTFPSLKIELSRIIWAATCIEISRNVRRFSNLKIK